MTYTLLSVSSVTYAMKAKSLLNTMGYFCEIERRPKNPSSGCGYALRVRDDPDLISTILQRNGITVRDLLTVERGSETRR